MAAAPLTWPLFFRHMLRSNAAVTAAVAVGDVGCQATEGRFGAQGTGWDAARTQRMMIAAFCATGPLSFSWNRFLEARLPGRELKTVFVKLLANAGFAPVQIATSFTVLTLLSGKSLAEAQKKVKQDMVFTFLVGSTFWPFVGFLQFRFVPWQHRPFVGSVAGAAYNVFFSRMANRPVTEEDGTVAPVVTPELPVLSPRAGERPHSS